MMCKKCNINCIIREYVNEEYMGAMTKGYFCPNCMKFEGDVTK